MEGFMLFSHKFASYFLLTLFIWVLHGCVSTSNLHEAVENGKYKSIKNAINNDDINLLNNSGKTPLHIAVIEGRIKVVKLLVESGADINARAFGGRTPYSYAIINKHDNLVKYFQNRNVKVKFNYKNTNLLFDAAISNNTFALDFILNNGVDINIVNQNKESALHMASASGNNEAVQILIEKGVDPFQKSNNGMLAIHFAAFYENYSLVDLYSDMGIQPIETKNDTMGFHSTANLFSFLGEKNFSIGNLEKAKQYFQVASINYSEASSGYKEKQNNAKEEIEKADKSFAARFIIVTLLAGAQANLTGAPQTGIVSRGSTKTYEELEKEFFDLAARTKKLAEQYRAKGDSI